MSFLPRSLRIIIPIALLALGASSAWAQLEVRIQPEARTFVAHSPVNVKVSIINRSARDLTLRGPTPRASWLNFRITNNKGDLITTRPDAPLAGAIKVAASKSVSLRVNLNLGNMRPIGERTRLKCCARLLDQKIVTSIFAGHFRRLKEGRRKV